VAVLHELIAAARLRIFRVLQRGEFVRACNMANPPSVCATVSKTKVSSLIPFGFASLAVAPSGRDTSGILFRAMWAARASGSPMAESRAAAGAEVTPSIPVCHHAGLAAALRDDTDGFGRVRLGGTTLAVQSAYLLMR